MEFGNASLNGVEYKVTIGEMWGDFGAIYGLRWGWKVGVVMELGSV